jgi:hypothetical protein
MSGRLIITGKKSYTPWNKKNVERVLRDERVAKEREIAEAEQRRQREGERRISTMKRLRSDDESHPNIGEEEGFTSGLKHVNLFEDEEAAQRCASSKNDTKAGIMPVFLVPKSDSSISPNEFYKRKTNTRLDSEDKIKKENDPMREFTTSVNRGHSESKIVTKKSEKQPPTENKEVIRENHESSSISTLRRRQMERDALHSKREEALRRKLK